MVQKIPRNPTSKEPMNQITPRTKLPAEEREALEEMVWRLPRIQRKIEEVGEDFDVIQGFTDQELFDILDQKRVERASKPRPPKRIHYPRPVLTSYDYLEIEGQLRRKEEWTHWGAAGTWTEEVIAPVGKRVRWEGRTVSASLVLHWVRTGDMPRRVPKAPQKRFRALVRIKGTLTHIGYYSTPEARDIALGLAKIGIYPNGVTVCNDA